MKTNIGGQAVIEGVYMRGSTAEALAVRDSQGQVRIESKRISSSKVPKNSIKKLPFVRGVVNLASSLSSGTAMLLKSAEVAGEEEFEATELGDKKMKVLLAFSSFIGVALAIGLFFLLPNIVATGVINLFGWELNDVTKNIVEGVIKLIILVGYMLLISLLKDIKRVFMYHGAEHKTISCYEAEMPLTVDNVSKCSTIHDRCGTSFTVYVVIISIIVSIFFGWSENMLLRLVIRLLMILPIAGISYEVLKLLSKSESKLLIPFKWLGWQMQKITTKQPTDDMIEVAIASFSEVLRLQGDENAEVLSFPKSVFLSEFYAHYCQRAVECNIDISDVDWMFTDTLKIKRELLASEKAKKINVAHCWQVAIALQFNKCHQGEPLQYVQGYTEFYGIRLAVDKRVLIPRQETELLAERVIKATCDNSNVLDMCCGSGAIAIAVALNSKATVTAVDVSKEALIVATANATVANADIRFVLSDMFAGLEGDKFDIIVSNPPYIPTKDIISLDTKVSCYEPQLALDGGFDGLVFYRKLAEFSPNFLNDGGKLMLEVGIDQASEVVSLLNDKFDCEVIKDYSGIDRMIIANIKNNSEVVNV